MTVTSLPITRRSLGLGLAAALAVPRFSLAQSVAIPPRFESVGHFHEGLAPAREGGLWGFIDTSGGWVVRPRYDGVLRGGDGRFGIQQGESWGFADSGGNVVVEPRYEAAQPFRSGVAAVKRRGLWGFITPQGSVETPFRFEAVGRREGFHFPAVYRGRSGTEGWHLLKAIPGTGFSETGELSVQDPATRQTVQPEKVHGFSEGATVASYTFGEILYDVNGWRQVDGDWPHGVIFDSIRRRSEGWAAATRDGQWGFIDDQRRYRAYRELEGAREFTEGVAPIRVDGKWGYMTKNEKIAFPPRLTRAYSFHEGFATMREGKKRGFLRNDGGRISIFVDGTYEDVFRFQEGLAPIKVDGKWGFLSSGARRATHSVRGVVDVIPQ